MLSEAIEFESWVTGWTTPAPSTYQCSNSLAFQRWFKFKEAFSPALVREVIEFLPKKPKHILDCFGGSGTTAIVARMLGISSTLIEVNPFLADLIDAKLTDYSGYDLPSEVTNLLKASAQTFVSLVTLRDRLPPTFVEPGKDGRWIFSSDAALAIEQLLVAISEVNSAKLQRMFRVALGSILIEASNVRIDGKGRRYRTRWQDRHVDATTIRQLFVEAISRMVEDVARFPVGKRASKHKLLRGDSRELISQLSTGNVDFAIFSPPYPNSFDYTDIYNVELWMLGYFCTASDNRNLRLQTMRSHVQVGWPTEFQSIGSKTLDSTIDRLREKSGELWNKRIPDMVIAYFNDLDCIIRNISNVLASDGHVAIVVGNSSYAGITVDSSIVLKEIADKYGFAVKKCESVRVMRTSSQQSMGTKKLDEWLLILGRC